MYTVSSAPTESQPNSVAAAFRVAQDLGRPIFVGEAGVKAHCSGQCNPDPTSNYEWSCLNCAADLCERASLIDAKLDAAFTHGAAGYLLWQFRNPAPASDLHGIYDGDPVWRNVLAHSPHAPPAPSITTTPVVSVSDRQVTFTWSTDVEADARVALGHTSANPPVYGLVAGDADTNLKTDHTVVINGLAWGQSYAYQIRSAGLAGAETPPIEGTFSTPTAPSNVLLVTAFGDNAADTNTDAVVAATAAEPSAVHVLSGDWHCLNNDANTAQHWWDVTWAPLRNRTLLMALGNHEYDFMSSDYDPLFNMNLVGPEGGFSGTPPYTEDSPRWFSHLEPIPGATASTDKVYIIVVDSELFRHEGHWPTLHTEQELFLTEQLQLAQAYRWTVVVTHHQAMSSGKKHAVDEGIANEWRPLFDQYGVDLVLSGHEHSYERTLPACQNETVGTGCPVYMVVGTGGRGLSTFDVVQPAWSRKRVELHGYTRLEFMLTDLHVQFITKDGDLYDVARVLPNGADLSGGWTPPASGACTASAAPGVCGDGICDTNEDCNSCAGDCGACPVCPDGICNGTEDCTSCPTDCGACPQCGDGICNGNEDCVSCPADCSNCPVCGDGQCDSSENCANCPQDCPCPTCGDGACNGNEDCASCAVDCGPCPTCPDGVCNGSENCTTCPADCGACGNQGLRADLKHKLYLKDADGTWYDTGRVRPAIGQWSELTFEIPTSADLPLRELGVEISNHDSYQGALYYDHITVGQPTATPHTQYSFDASPGSVMPWMRDSNAIQWLTTSANVQHDGTAAMAAVLSPVDESTEVFVRYPESVSHGDVLSIWVYVPCDAPVYGGDTPGTGGACSTTPVVPTPPGACPNQGYRADLRYKLYIKDGNSSWEDGGSFYPVVGEWSVPRFRLPSGIVLPIKELGLFMSNNSQGFVGTMHYDQFEILRNGSTQIELWSFESAIAPWSHSGSGITNITLASSPVHHLSQSLQVMLSGANSSGKVRIKQPDTPSDLQVGDVVTGWIHTPCGAPPH